MHPNSSFFYADNRKSTICCFLFRNIFPPKIPMNELPTVMFVRTPLVGCPGAWGRLRLVIRHGPGGRAHGGGRAPRHARPPPVWISVQTLFLKSEKKLWAMSRFVFFILWIGWSGSLLMVVNVLGGFLCLPSSSPLPCCRNVPSKHSPPPLYGRMVFVWGQIFWFS